MLGHVTNKLNYVRTYVDELIVSKYVAESINNWLQDALAMKAFVSCVQNALKSVAMSL